MDTAPVDGTTVRLQGSHHRSEEVVTVLGRYDTGGHTEGWEDERGNWFHPTGWKPETAA